MRDRRTVRTTRPATPGGALALAALLAPRVASAAAPPPIWSVQTQQWDCDFGQAVAIGDFDGDGFDDTAVGAPAYDDGQSDEGAVYVYAGSALGPSQVETWSTESGAAYLHLGSSLAAADLNGDGYDDLAVGGPLGPGKPGIVEVFFGSATGLAAAPAWSASGETVGSRFGESVARAGDVDGDGFDDLVVGAPDAPNGAFDRAGAAYLFLGSAGGLPARPDWIARGAASDLQMGIVRGAGDTNGDGRDDVAVTNRVLANGRDVLVYFGSRAGLAPAPGWSAAATVDPAEVLLQSDGPAGDVDGDGFDDLLVTADTDAGPTVLLYRGSAAGPEAATSWSSELDRTSADVGSAGDVNGDGFDDLAIGDQMVGLEIFLGAPTGPQRRPVWVLGADLFTVASGDVDGDGLSDPASGYSYGRGSVSVWLGEPMPDADGDFVVDEQDLCPTVPDVAQLDDDGDALGNACDEPAIAVSGVLAAGQQVEVRVTGLAPGETAELWGALGAGGAGPCPASLGGLCLELGPGAASLGVAVADDAGAAVVPLTMPGALAPNGRYVLQASVARGVGGALSVVSPVLPLDGDDLDWDADGLSDADELRVGTDPRDPDTDGDGLRDGDELPAFDPLLADTDADGVPDPDDTCWYGDDRVDPDTDGVPSRCDRCPLTSDPAQADLDRDGVGDACEGPALATGVEVAHGGAAGLHLGRAVATAGDVDGDGYDDVAVASDGGAAVFHGSAAGLRAPPAWRLPTVTTVAHGGDVDGDGYDDLLVGTTAGIGLVYGSVAGLSNVPGWGAPAQGPAASAGDVNGDGYDDVIAGAVTWHGSAAGPVRSAWAPTTPSPATIRAVASAGDVNGDGYDDAVVGTSGRAYVFLGSPAGLADQPAAELSVPWFAGAYTYGSGASFGWSVASAGDVNGDGYDDVIVGDPLNEPSYDHTTGRAWLFLGDPDGLGPGAQVIDLDLTLHEARLGASVASAGDVDGDGFDDVVVGAPGGLGGYATAGAAYLFLGSVDGLAEGAAWVGHRGLGRSFGQAVSSAGDVDGDGLDDVLIGAPDDGHAEEGEVWSYRGQRR